MHGKIVNGIFYEAPDNMICDIIVNGEKKPFMVFCPTDEQYEAAGYLPVDMGKLPDNDSVYELEYTERDGVIYAEWKDTAVSDNGDTTLEERVEILEDELGATKILLGVDE